MSRLATFRGWGRPSGCVVASGSQWIGDDSHRGMVVSSGVQEGFQQYLNKTIIECGLRVLIKVPKGVKNRELILNASAMLGFILDTNTIECRCKYSRRVMYTS